MDIAASTNRRQSILLQKARRSSVVKIFEDAPSIAQACNSCLDGQRRVAHPKSVIRPALPSVSEQLPEPATTKAAPLGTKNNTVSIASIHRDARRRTIWIPHDDTTVMTIHPGAHTHALKDETLQIAIEPEPGAPHWQSARPRKKRPSLLEPPKRVPMVSLVRAPTNAVLGNIPGQQTGKENLSCPEDDIKKVQDEGAIHVRPVRQSAITLRMSPITGHPRPATSMRPSTVADVQPRGQQSVLEDKKTHDGLLQNAESDWLGSQEASMTGIINAIFVRERKQRSEANEGDKRRTVLPRLAAMLRQEEVEALCHRVDTSLSSGVLSISSLEAERILNDVDFRKKALRLWIDTYDHRLLHDALQAIVDYFGVADLDSTASASGISSKSDRALLGRLLWTALTRAGAHETDTAVPMDHNRFWQRMMLRSVILAVILDRAIAQTIAHGCLFQQTAKYKSTKEFLVALGRIQLPCVPDLVRRLHHLGFESSTSQDFFQEVNYHVDNLAVDLRDGVILARLVECMMQSENVFDSGAMSLKVLPQDPGLETVHWPLSRNLRYPADTRTHKLYNVDISISALGSTRGLSQTAVSTTTAADIVDGHREKTLSLLWAIVSRWGLQWLCPLALVRGEIAYLRAHPPASLDARPLTPRSVPDALFADLQTWVTLICEQAGLEINDLTTSFASDAAFLAILSHYLIHLRSETDSLSHCARSELERKLNLLGLSDAFASLFSHGDGNAVPAKSTTLCLLSLLASKLLPQAKRDRAARTLQRAWRHRLHERERRAKIAAKRAAEDCAEVVEFGNRIERAATTLQRSWRKHMKRSVSP